MNNLAIVKPSALTGAEEIKVLKDSLFRGFTDAEINYCVAICNQLNLSPLLRQIHFVKRKVKDGENRWKEIIVAQTGIDGFRLVAQRAGGYAGSDDAVFECGQNEKIPLKATVTVYKMVDGQRCAFIASARWDEYFPVDEKQRFMWNKMPNTMLAKCAESLALRKAFPAELSALRSDEEMQQADVPSKAEQVQARVAPSQAKTIETTATQVDEPNHEPGDAADPTEIQDHFCSLCNAKLVKSERKPVLYCPNWKDKSKGDHGIVNV